MLEEGFLDVLNGDLGNIKVLEFKKRVLKRKIELSSKSVLKI